MSAARAAVGVVTFEAERSLPRRLEAGGCPGVPVSEAEGVL